MAIDQQNRFYGSFTYVYIIMPLWFFSPSILFRCPNPSARADSLFIFHKKGKWKGELYASWGIENFALHSRCELEGTFRKLILTLQSFLSNTEVAWSIENKYTFREQSKFSGEKLHIDYLSTCENTHSIKVHLEIIHLHQKKWFQANGVK